MCATQASTLATGSAACDRAARTSAVAFAPTHCLRPTSAAFHHAAFTTAVSDAPSVALLLRVASSNLTLLGSIVFNLVRQWKCE
ncbi:hypothetical protein PI124_g2448 [Phytophthora idaei]|nr:hypothetical protein PC115_g739 [Phytophthora cactorum]KAG3101863.1 hypothetical protein PC122_g2530 [Phytophthora cactorum]KAG3253015.1 hypothetical protein PI124_g2448 [Phytophthora idaei]